MIRFVASRAAALGLVVLATWGAGSTEAVAQNDGRPQFVSARVGFAGHFKLGYWTAVELTLRGGLQAETGVVSMTVPDAEGVPVRYVSSRLAVPPGQMVRTTLLVKPGRDFNELPVQFRSSEQRPVDAQFDDSLGQAVFRKSLPWPPNQSCVVVVGASIGLSESSGSTAATAVVVLGDAAELPPRWQGYEGLDALVITTSRPEALKQLRDNSAQLAALESWVEMGGRLVFCVGAEAHSVLAPQHPLARFAPGSLEEVVSLRQTAALETYSGTSYRVPLVGKGQAAALQVPRLRQQQGVVELSEGDLPLVVCWPRCFGEVTFVGLDLDRRPLADWQGRQALVDRLLTGKAVGPPAEEESPATTAAASGFQDLAGLLRAALDIFTGIRVVPFWIVGGLVLVYILVIGPGDFFLVKNVLKRMELTWLTFPATVVVVTLGALWLAHWAKGDMLLVNQVDVVDIDTGCGQVRGTTWVNVFSPVTARYDVAIVPQWIGAQESRSEVLLSGLGLAGRAWGGMNSPAAGPQLFLRPYDAVPALDALLGVPIDVWSTKGVNARWRTATGDPAMEARLTVRPDQSLEGSLTSRLDFPLSNCWLAYDRWAWGIGRLQPGETAQIKLGSHVSLQAALRDFRIIEQVPNQGFVQQPVALDVHSRDVPLIVRMMMFAEAAEAAGHTGLAGCYQQFIDLSRQLKLGRAILTGQAQGRSPAVQLQLDGQPVSSPRDQHWVFCRFLLPVVP